MPRRQDDAPGKGVCMTGGAQDVQGWVVHDLALRPRRHHATSHKHKAGIYFPEVEDMQKVADVLNAYLRRPAYWKCDRPRGEYLDEEVGAWVPCHIDRGVYPVYDLHEGMVYFTPRHGYRKYRTLASLGELTNDSTQDNARTRRYE